MTAGAPLLHGSGAVIRSILALLALYAATAAAIGRKPVRPMEARVEQMERLLEQSQQRASQAEAVIQQMQEAMQQQAARAAAQDAAAEAARAIWGECAQWNRRAADGTDRRHADARQAAELRRQGNRLDGATSSR